MLPPDCAAAGLESRPHGSGLVDCATAGLEPRPLTLPGGGVLVYCYDIWNLVVRTDPYLDSYRGGWAIVW